jgi:hypothetical protein
LTFLSWLLSFRALNWIWILFLMKIRFFGRDMAVGTAVVGMSIDTLEDIVVGMGIDTWEVAVVVAAGKSTQVADNNMGMGMTVRKYLGGNTRNMGHGLGVWRHPKKYNLPKIKLGLIFQYHQ